MKLHRGLLAAAVLAVAAPAFGYIEALNSLKGVFQESDVIARGTVDAVSAEKKVIILKVAKSMKGKSVYEKIRIDLNAGQDWHGDAVLRHATVGSAVSVFYHKGENTDKAAVSLIYLNRFFLTAQPDEVMWRLGKIELGMTKVYHGTAEELNDLAGKILSGRSKAPEPRADLKPFTKEALQQLPPPPKEGDKWEDFDASKVLKAQ
jgi:hypothetical protein